MKNVMRGWVRSCVRACDERDDGGVGWTGGINQFTVEEGRKKRWWGEEEERCCVTNCSVDWGRHEWGRAVQLATGVYERVIDGAKGGGEN